VCDPALGTGQVRQGYPKAISNEARHEMHVTHLRIDWEGETKIRYREKGWESMDAVGSGRSAGDDITLLAWNDYVGLTRCRGIPAEDLQSRTANGLGWAVAGQALTPFADIAANPWGPMLEVRQVPVLQTHTRVDIWPDAPAFDLVLCDSRLADGSDWDCCVRAFMRSALSDFKAMTGLTFMAAFEHEFLLTGPGLAWAPPFSVETMRNIAPLAGQIARALREANLAPETVEPEFGVLQFEVTTAPGVDADAGDRAVLTREVIREVARRNGLRACFSPKPDPAGVGNGSHVHFSFLDDQGRNATYDPTGPGELSAVAQSFVAGVVRHMPALTALVAPSPVSYLRLGPQHWSCGFASFGIQNREAAIRACPSVDRDPARRERGFNLEFRPPDATASPYLVIGSLVRAGLAGVRDNLALPPACEADPAELTDAQRRELGIVPLPATLEEALAAFEADEVARTWLPEVMRDSYLSVKRLESSMAAGLTAKELADRYAEAY